MKKVLNSTGIESGLTLVLGGTGKTGRRIAERLRRLGMPTRVVARHTEPAFDWNDRDSWAPVLDGVGAVYLNYAPDLAVPGATEAVRAFTAMAVAGGVGRLVLLSGRGEEEAQRAEQIVRQAGVEWTVVRASWFNQNFSEGEFAAMVADGVIALPAGEIPEPFVDVNDIADVAVAALTQDQHHGEVYEVTGPDLLTFADLAQQISSALGREIRYRPIPQPAFVEALAREGTPKDMTWLLNYLFETVLDGRNAKLGDGVQRALGREPRSFNSFAREVAAAGMWRRAS